MFHKTINLIKMSYFLKKKNLKIKLNKKETKILKIFLQLNIIRLVKKNNKILNIHFQYINNEPIFKSIKNIYRPSKLLFMNSKQIIKINKKNNYIFFLSTNKGVINNFEAEKYKTGGILILKIKI